MIMKENKCEKVSFFLFISIIFASSTYAAEILDNYEYPCLPKEKFAVENLRPWDSKDKLIRTLGKPLKITESMDVDDGGEYQVFTYHYEHIKVDIARSKIDKIYVTSNKIVMLSKIKTGITKVELGKILNIDLEKIAVSNNKYSIVRCSDKDIWHMDYLNFTFDDSNILKEFQFEANRP